MNHPIRTARIVVTVAATLALLQTAAAATVTGTVTFKGEVPKPSKIPITKDNDVCGQGQRIIDEVVVNEDATLQHVAVFVHGRIAGIEAPAGYPTHFEMVQKGCRFNPFVATVPKGQALKIVHAYELIGRARRDLFNFQQPEEGHTRTELMRTRRGNIVQLQCDIHDFMRGWIVVPENPFATVAEDGRYSLSGIPAGERTIMAFHPVLGLLEKKITLVDGQDTAVDFEFSSE